MVEYKSEDSVVLDCDYDMGEEDKARNSTIPHIIIVFFKKKITFVFQGTVVNWFFRRSHMPFLQWIPG